MDGHASAAGLSATGRERIFGLHPLTVALMVQVLVWTLGPALIFGNLHADTLEAAYWGRDWALGYAKHPPMATWMMDLALRTGLQPIFALMLLSQLTVVVTAYFVWRIARLFASRETAALAVLLYVVSPAATVYAVQINHNSLLAPFWAGTAYLGLLFLEERRWSHAVLLGLVAGLGVLTKYELLFVLVSLLVLGAATPRYRPAFFHPASYLAGFVFLLVIAPHVWWLETNRWPSLSRAMGSEKIDSVTALNGSAINLIVGLFTLLAAPCAILLGTIRQRGADMITSAPGHRMMATILGFVPLVVLILGALATMQVLKPLWVLPLSSTVAVALAVLFPAGGAEEGLSVKRTAQIISGASAAVFAGFALYLVVAGAIGKPLTAYSADTKKLAEATQALWAENRTTPLTCVVVADRKIGPSGVLWLKGRPDFLDFSSVGWQTPAQIGECRRSGAIAVIADGANVLDSFPAACKASVRRFDVPTAPGMGKVLFPLDLSYIPPEGDPRCPSR